MASKAGQATFNKLNGSSPMRLDIDVADLDPVGRSTLEDLRSAKIRMLTRSKAVWDAGLEAFAKTRDKAALLRVYRENPPR